MIILDACVLIAFADPANLHHAAAVEILTTCEPLAVSALTGAEVMVHPPAAAETGWRQMFNDFGIKVLPLTEAEMGLLAATRRSTRLRMPDAIVVCLAQREGAAVASFDDRLIAKATELGLPTYPKGPPAR